MGSKVFVFLSLLLAFVLLVSSQVASADKSIDPNKEKVTRKTNGVEEAKYYGYYNGGGYPGGGHYYYGGGGGHPSSGGGGYHGGGYCRFGCCGGSSYGRGCGICCSYAGESAPAPTPGN